MGQKVHPYGFRLGYNKTWISNWYARKGYSEQLIEDMSLRKHIFKTLSHAGISKVEIERSANRVRINIHTARPGIIIGKKGLEVDRLKEELQKVMSGKQVNLNIKEVRRAELEAPLIAQNIALQLEKRVSFRRAMKKSVVTALRFGAKGIKATPDTIQASLNEAISYNQPTVIEVKMPVLASPARITPRTA